MRTVGNLLKEARRNKNLSINDVEEMTHIRSSFIRAIEEAEWDKLPHENIIVGFIKSISHFLDIDERYAVSLFRREYLPQEKKEIQKPKVYSRQIGRKFTWGPRLTFLVGVIVIVVVVLGYLGFQYKKFNSPPELIINSPTEGQTVERGTLEIKGMTDPDATVEINNQSIIVEDNGNFNGEIDVSSNTTQINIKAESRSGKTTTLSRKIIVKP
jgi:cytoskeletal protein RodZ